MLKITDERVIAEVFTRAAEYMLTKHGKGGSEMKAWSCYEGCPSEGVLLVYAETRNKAKYMAVLYDPWEWEYQYNTCVRRKEFDSIFKENKVIAGNNELPESAPRFYLDRDEDNGYFMGNN